MFSPKQQQQWLLEENNSITDRLNQLLFAVDNDDNLENYITK